MPYSGGGGGLGGWVRVLLGHFSMESTQLYPKKDMGCFTVILCRRTRLRGSKLVTVGPGAIDTGSVVNSH